MSVPATAEEFEDITLVGIDLDRCDPPGRRMLETSAMDLVTGDHAPLGGVVFLLDREPPEGWGECFEVAERDLGYEDNFVAKLVGSTLELDYDSERFEERFKGLTVAVTHANLAFRAILVERAERRRLAEETRARYRTRIEAAARSAGIPTLRGETSRADEAVH